jgi:integrase
VLEHPRGLAEPVERSDVGEHRSELRHRLDTEFASVTRRLNRDQLLSDQSVPRMANLISRFERFLSMGCRVDSLIAVVPSIAASFVNATSVGTGSPPAVATMHLRRSAIRLLFRIARELEIVDSDPTLDLVLPPRSSTSARPLLDDEIALCRVSSLHSLTETRLSAAWALAEATVRSAELARVVRDDVDLAAARVWIRGSSRTNARWGDLSPWGVTQIERRLRTMHAADGGRPIIYSGDGSAESRQAASCHAIAETLRRAGLAREHDVRPTSVAGWAGTRVLDGTGRIEAVAHALGVTSLDRAARLIGWDWHEA